MKNENRNLLVGLVKIKELRISELEKNLTDPPDTITRLTQNIIDTMKIECKVLSQIVNSEPGLGT